MKEENAGKELIEFAKEFSEAYLIELELELKQYALSEDTIKKLEQETKKFALYVRKRG